ncbi:universal stress protein [Roseibium marinum]|uniref:Nucleotide-binding universal stress UspA family protein n=1 Tax=Roseibium marinum TaxID=281252 RepID=A0A2S3UKT3_9HYPH|nr:universal stress protein [Roseibium marinum]POF28170.1 nucleotide-binding universal stress UspA family protein [Roseibium marinum]
MFKKILVPLDPAEPGFADEALAKASQLARDYGAKIHVLAVCPEVQSFVASQLPEGWQQREIEATRLILDEISAKLDVPAGEVDSQVRMGTVYHEVIEEAEASGCDLILMTSHKPGLSTYFIGSNAAHIVRHAPCSVMVLRGS